MITFILVLFSIVVFLTDEVYRRFHDSAYIRAIGKIFFDDFIRSISIYELTTASWLISGFFDFNILYIQDPSSLLANQIIYCLFAAFIIVSVAIWQYNRFYAPEIDEKEGRIIYAIESAYSQNVNFHNFLFALFDKFEHNTNSESEEYNDAKTELLSRDDEIGISFKMAYNEWKSTSRQ